MIRPFNSRSSKPCPNNCRPLFPDNYKAFQEYTEAQWPSKSDHGTFKNFGRYVIHGGITSNGTVNAHKTDRLDLATDSSGRLLSGRVVPKLAGTDENCYMNAIRP